MAVADHKKYLAENVVGERRTVCIDLREYGFPIDLSNNRSHIAR